MTDTPGPVTPGPRFLPVLRSRWWSVLLVHSLMVNFLFLGLMAGQFYRHGPPDRLSGVSYVQLIPRQFFRDLPRERRRELLAVIGDHRDDLRGSREAFEATAAELAEALAKEPYDADAAHMVIEGFAEKSNALAAKGGLVVKDILARLTPEERALLVKAIRARGSRKR